MSGRVCCEACSPFSSIHFSRWDFCKRRLFGSSASGFSASQGCLAVAPQDFLHRRLARQKIVTFFCAGSSFVKKQRLFSAPEARSSKNSDFFLRRRLVRQKTVTFFCAGGSRVKKR